MDVELLARIQFAVTAGFHFLFPPMSIGLGVILVIIGGPGAIPTPNEQAMKLLPVAIVGMVLGPSISGILLTGLVYGRSGLREFRSRLLKWRVNARWYVIALLMAPILIMIILFAFSQTFPISFEQSKHHSLLPSLICFFHPIKPHDSLLSLVPYQSEL